VVLLKVIEYLAYKVQYADFNTEDITEDFSDRIDPYIALELWVAAPHLASPRLSRD
jgi:transcription elongation factor B subunit 1